MLKGNLWVFQPPPFSDLFGSKLSLRTINDLNRSSDELEHVFYKYTATMSFVDQVIYVNTKMLKRGLPSAHPYNIIKQCCSMMCFIP